MTKEMEYLDGGFDIRDYIAKRYIPHYIFYGLIILVVILIIIAVIVKMSKSSKEQFRRLLLQQEMAKNKDYKVEGGDCGRLYRGNKIVDLLGGKEEKPIVEKPMIETPTTEIAKEIGDKTLEQIDEITTTENTNMVNPTASSVPTTEPLDSTSANTGYILDNTVNTDREPEITNAPIGKPVVEGFNVSRARSKEALSALTASSSFRDQEQYTPMDVAMRKYIKEYRF